MNIRVDAIRPRSRFTLPSRFETDSPRLQATGVGTMTKPKAKLLPVDASKYLIDGAVVAEYAAAVLETEDPDLLLLALGDVTRASGMAQIAKDAGLGRESLYKALCV
jgi:probable addiction module antidote protein